MDASNVVRVSSMKCDQWYARETVCGMLSKADTLLPNEYRLLLVEAYRSPERQAKLWDEAVGLVKAINPGLSIDEAEKEARRFVAQPKYRLGGHQTGGAVDITLSDEVGRLLDLGTAIQEFNALTRTYASGLTTKQKHLRKLLLKAMESVGFVNYPEEWWHFSYGDQLWAAHLGRKSAIYGPASPPEPKKLPSR